MVQADPEQTHDFSNSVIAVFEADHTELVIRDLSAAGFDAEVLIGESGRSHLDATADGGLIAGLKKLARSFGDETRIVGALDAALEQGKSVISVDADDARAPDAARIMEDHGGTYVWRFGEWSFNRVGDLSEEEEPEQAPEAAKGTVDEETTS